MEDENDEEEEEIVGSLLSSLESIILRRTPISQDKLRNQSEKDQLLSRHASLATETFENAGRRGYLSGHLTKLGHVYKTWRQRFFILNDVKRLLFYYGDAKTGGVKGVIELAGADVLRDVTRGKDLCFQISYPRNPSKRRFLLYAENQRDLQLWLKALNHVSQHKVAQAVSPSKQGGVTPSVPPATPLRLDTRLRVGKAERIARTRSTSLSPPSSFSSASSSSSSIATLSSSPPTCSANNPLRRSRSVSTSSSSSRSARSPDTVTPLLLPSPWAAQSPPSTEPASSPLSLSPFSSPLMSPPPSPSSSPSSSSPPALFSLYSASSTALPESLPSSLLPPDSPGTTRRSSLPILPSQHHHASGPTARTPLRTLLQHAFARTQRPQQQPPPAGSHQPPRTASSTPPSPLPGTSSVPRVPSGETTIIHNSNGREVPPTPHAGQPNNTTCAGGDAYPRSHHNDDDDDEGKIERHMTAIAVHVDDGLVQSSSACEEEDPAVDEPASPPPPCAEEQDAAVAAEGEEEETGGEDREPTSADFAARFQWLIDANRAKVLAQVEPHGAETGGWTLVREEGNVLVSKKELRDSSLIMTRAEGRIRARASRVLSLIQSLQYDPLVTSCERIKKITEDVDIAHLRARSPFPFVSNRDFVLLRSVHRDAESGTYVACATSIPELPFSSLHLSQGEGEFVRGEVLNSGWTIEPFGEVGAYAADDGDHDRHGDQESEEVYCTYVVCVDPRGLVPNWVVNMFQARDVHTAFTRLKHFAEQSRASS